MSLRTIRILVEDTIKESCFELEVGETAKSICPFCKAIHETSLSVTRNEQGLVYNCFRAGCSAKGFISGLAGSIIGTTHIRQFKAKKYSRHLEALPPIILKMMYKRYQLTEEELYAQGIKFSRDEYRLFMPTFDSRGDEFGGISKTLQPNLKRFKTINYFNRETTRLHYPRSTIQTGTAIAVVEDILSSIKVSRFMRCVAALGHNLSMQQIQELRRQTDHLVLLLDSDVFSKALAMKRRYSLYFRNFSVIYLSKGLDPKDTEHEDLEDILYEFKK